MSIDYFEKTAMRVMINKNTAFIEKVYSLMFFFFVKEQEIFTYNPICYDLIKYKYLFFHIQ